MLITYQIPHPFNPAHVIIKSEEIDGLTFLKRHCDAEQIQKCQDIFDTLFPPLNLASLARGNSGDNEDDPPPPRKKWRRRKRKRRDKERREASKVQVN